MIRKPFKKHPKKEVVLAICCLHCGCKKFLIVIEAHQYCWRCTSCSAEWTIRELMGLEECDRSEGFELDEE